MLSILNSNNIDYFKELLLQLERLYIESFPIDEEREDFSVIISRVKNGDATGVLSSLILLDIDNCGKVVRGGAIYDWYTRCGALEMIYIMVDKQYRQRGIGRSLFKDAIPLIGRHCSYPIKNVFFESENPAKTDINLCPMDPVVRLAIYNKWGAKRIPLNYIQPPLQGRTKPADNLYLFCLPVQDEDYIDRDELIDFLTEFYRGLHAELSSELERMVEHLKSQDKKIALLSVSPV